MTNSSLPLMVSFTHDWNVSAELSFQRQLQDTRWFSVDGSCNGLVLARDELCSTYLINPTTENYHKVPFPNFPPPVPATPTRLIYGFGYDNVSADYKVVALSYCPKGYNCDIAVDVYSLRNRLWRRLDTCPYPSIHGLTCGGKHVDFGDDFASGVFLNGRLHWLAREKTYVIDEIAAFDLCDEKFSKVSLPDCGVDSYSTHLVVLRGCLCISRWSMCCIWMLKDYGVKESWTKIEIRLGVYNPLCSMNDDDIVFRDRNSSLGVYNLKENHRRILIGTVPPRVSNAQTFIKSLVSPFSSEGIA